MKVTEAVRVHGPKPPTPQRVSIKRRCSTVNVDTLWCGHGSRCQAKRYSPTSHYCGVQSPPRYRPFPNARTLQCGVAAEVAMTTARGSNCPVGSGTHPSHRFAGGSHD